MFPFILTLYIFLVHLSSTLFLWRETAFQLLRILHIQVKVSERGKQLFLIDKLLPSSIIFDFNNMVNSVNLNCKEAARKLTCNIEKEKKK